VDKRKGYNKRSAIPRDLLNRLNNGTEQATTLAEWLAVDPLVLLRAVLPQVGLGKHLKRITAAIVIMPDGVMDRHKRIGAELHEVMARDPRRGEIYKALASHPSDVAREWAALTVMADVSLSLQDRLALAKRFAADPSMNVREMAWLSFRPYIEPALEECLRSLQAWVDDENPYIRRCAIEAIRPRGVWCAHIKTLKERPQLGLSLLETARADESKYVRLSVGNWLNDASKSQPQWVVRVCRRWLKESPGAHTAWIVNHAQRTIRKAKEG
jgi:3-methyladenine DNA glycosylase AlkC